MVGDICSTLWHFVTSVGNYSKYFDQVFPSKILLPSLILILGHNHPIFRALQCMDLETGMELQSMLEPKASLSVSITIVPYI